MATVENCKPAAPPAPRRSQEARITVTMPPALRRRIEREARQERRSMTAHAVVLLERGLGLSEKEASAA